jgi:hypothetical protein
VAGVGVFVDAARRDPAGNLGSVEWRSPGVALADPEVDRHLDVRESKAPRQCLGDPVADQAGLSLARRFPVRGGEAGAKARVEQDRLVGGLGLVLEEPQRVLGEPFPASQRRAVAPAGSARMADSISRSSALRLSYASSSSSTGPEDETTATRVTRSGNRAPQASANGPPPEKPTTAKRSSPRASAICETISVRADKDGMPSGVDSP